MTETQRAHLAVWEFTQLPMINQLMLLIGANTAIDCETFAMKSLGWAAINSAWRNK